jgi:hypothetical protein
MLRNWQKNKDFEKQIRNISASISTLIDIAKKDEAISKFDQKKSYYDYKNYLCDNYDNRFFQMVFSFITGGGITAIALTISFPLGMFIPISLPILGLVMVVFSLLNYSRMTKQCQIARNPLDYLQDGYRKAQIKEIENIKIKYATISQGLNIFIATDIVAIILLSTVFSTPIAIPFLLASLTYLEPKSNQNIYDEARDQKRLQAVNNDTLVSAEFTKYASSIFDINSPYADLIANNKRVQILYDAEKNRALFYTPDIDNFLRDDQGNPVNSNTTLNSIDIEIQDEIKSLDLTAPSLAESAIYEIKDSLLLIDGDNIYGFIDKEGQYTL